MGKAMGVLKALTLTGFILKEELLSTFIAWAQTCVQAQRRRKVRSSLCRKACWQRGCLRSFTFRSSSSRAIRSHR
eukprot:scaffold261_cov336-Pavlova_lutheri.AAC.56